MNKTELIKKVAAENGLTQKAAADVVNCVFDSIMDSLGKKEPVSIFGFGNFSCKHRDAREGRNPATGKKIKIAASNTPVFKAAKVFKEKVN
ncbi:MAG: HU family DNA-binding protein [Oscillospiraceae bacterium]|nr:HU family DNA-binding protein [Oscillospiraceae bacterium]